MRLVFLTVLVWTPLGTVVRLLPAEAMALKELFFSAEDYVHLADEYYTGKDVELGRAKAAEHYQKAADKGSAKGQESLAMMHETGKGANNSLREGQNHNLTENRFLPTLSRVAPRQRIR
jgi:hypothetical protein